MLHALSITSIVAAMLPFEVILFQILFPCRFLCTFRAFIQQTSSNYKSYNFQYLCTDFNFNFILISLQSITFSISIVILVFQGYITTQFSVGRWSLCSHLEICFPTTLPALLPAILRRDIILSVGTSWPAAVLYSTLLYSAVHITWCSTVFKLYCTEVLLPSSTQLSFQVQRSGNDCYL